MSQPQTGNFNTEGLQVEDDWPTIDGDWGEICFFQN